MKPLISIIIPTYNRTHLLGETLNSILEQSFKSWECIIVDDGSKEDTFQLLKKYSETDKRFKSCHRPDHAPKGPSSCRNFGLEQAEGDFIVFLDSDDLLASDCLMNRLRFAKEYPDYDFYIFKTELFNESVHDLNQVFNIYLEVYSDKKYFDLFLKGLYPFCVSSVFWKTNKVKKIKGFDNKLIRLEDPELHIRAFKNGLKSITCEFLKPDNFYRKGINKTDVDNQKLVKATYRLFSLYLKNYPKQMRGYSLNFYRMEILLKTNIIYAFKFYFLFLASGILNFKQKVMLPILILYKVLNLDNINGLGFYSLTKKYVKQENL